MDIKQTLAECEAKIAALEPYKAASGEQARALFQHLKSRKAIQDAHSRLEKTRRHLEVNPNDLEVRAGMAVFEVCDPATWDDPLFMEMAVRSAEAILRGNAQ